MLLFMYDFSINNLCQIYFYSIYQTVLTFIFVEIDCEWNPWVNGTCTKECGTGTREDHRSIKVHSMYGGKPCKGPLSVIEECNSHPCPGIYLQVRVKS